MIPVFELVSQISSENTSFITPECTRSFKTKTVFLSLSSQPLPTNSLKQQRLTFVIFRKKKKDLKHFINPGVCEHLLFFFFLMSCLWNWLTTEDLFYPQNKHQARNWGIKEWGGNIFLKTHNLTNKNINQTRNGLALWMICQCFVFFRGNSREDWHKGSALGDIKGSVIRR